MIKNFNYRLLFLIALSLCHISGIFGQDYYYNNTKKIFLTKSKDIVIVNLLGGDDKNLRETFINNNPELSIDKKTNDINLDFCFMDFDNSISLSQLKSRNRNVLINQAYRTVDGTIQGFTDEFFVKLKPNSTYSEVKDFFRKYQVEFVRKNDFNPNLLVCRVVNLSQFSILEIINIFHLSGIFEYAEPIWKRKKIQKDVYDELWERQWSLENTGQWDGIPGADISMLEAWEITKGNSDIIVAVLDQGVDLDHPDLIGSLIQGYDATGQGTEGGYSSIDRHGTQCAGIIGAKHNNIGIAGIAPNCKIMPIRISSGDIWDDQWQVNAILYAKQNGADIMSCSWGGGSPSTSITNAINDAAIHGRDNLGCLLFFAAGNENSSVIYPGYLSNVIAVGALSMCNQRKRSSDKKSEVNDGVETDPAGVTCDGEKWWGSSYGPTLDISAPGVMVPSLDIDGETALFGGTSCATPHAAGVMALILSVNPCLTQIEARQILELSCDKINTTSYCYNHTSNHPHGNWNEEVGYGRINAYKALKYAFTKEISFNSNAVTTITSSDETKQVNFLGGCQLVASGHYFTNMSTITKRYTFPNTINPIVLGSTNGISAATDNNGNSYFSVKELTSNSVTVQTYTYSILNSNAQHIGWKPCQPSDIEFNIAVLSDITPNEKLENTIINTTKNVRVENKIFTKDNVIIETSGNVTLIAGNNIQFNPGFHVKNGAALISKIQPYDFTNCNKSRFGDMTTNEIPYFDESELIGLKSATIIMDVENVSRIHSTDEKMQIYPNPTNGIVKIETKDNVEYTYSIVSINGQMKEAKNNNIGISTIDLSNQEKGIYFIEIHKGDEIIRKKIIKM
ncbi:MAG: S8 family peptidase [Salinivirgaceae bacterium]|nr:S8 family peptidase [Salinivirgaceae bacterium]